MAKGVKRQSSRSYNSAKRDEQAKATRWAILQAARGLFLDRGYGATTIHAIADEAGVAVQTVYAAFGNKREILKQVVDVSVVGDDEPIPMSGRDAVLTAGKEPDARRRGRMAAAIIRGVVENSASVFKIARDAASTDPEVAELYRTLMDDRRQGMAGVARMLAGPDGALRVSPAAAAETLFILYSPDVALLAVEELGWSYDKYESWMAEMLERALLK